MDVVSTSLEALILKATQEWLPAPEPAALEAFCAVLRDSPEGPQLATRALAARVQSRNPREAILALVALDRCMRRCDASFHAEVGKFRFLNELIKLVSPKYYADRTAPEVRQRVLQLLHAWTIEYPKETKFKVSYDMLRNQGVVKETPPPLPPEEGSPPPPRARSAVFENEERSQLLKTLLHSKDPEHLQTANRLIKCMVQEEERRTEASSRRALEVQSAVDSARLLSELLEHAEEAGEDERQLMKELYEACRRHHPILLQLADATTDEEALEEILPATEEILQVFEKYQKIIVQKQQSDEHLLQDSKVTNGSDSLLDLAGINLGKTQEQSCEKQTVRSRDMDTLSDIFATENGATSSVKPLIPFSLMSSDVDLLDTGASSKSPTVSGLAALDSLGADLLQQSLPGSRIGDGFAGKSVKKIPMNSIEKSSPPDAKPNHSNTLDFDFLINKSKEAVKSNPPPLVSPSRTLDDLMLDITMDNSRQSETSKYLSDILSNDQIRPLEVTESEVVKDISTPKKIDKVAKIEDNANSSMESNMNAKSEANASKNVKVEVKPLTDLNVTLESVTPSKVPPLAVFEEEGGVSVVLHVVKNKPRPDVNVIVVSTTSKNPSPIEDYKFQAVVPKGCKVRLLPASGTALPAANPFLPPPAITQIMLIARPPTDPPTRVSLKFVITYNCEDDSVSELGEVTTLPLDDL